MVLLALSAGQLTYEAKREKIIWALFNCLAENGHESVTIKAIAQQEVAEIEQEFKVISKRLFAGKTIVHVIDENAPQGFEQAPTNLEDVYFSTLNEHRSTEQNDQTTQINNAA